MTGPPAAGASAAGAATSATSATSAASTGAATPAGVAAFAGAVTAGGASAAPAPTTGGAPGSGAATHSRDGDLDGFRRAQQLAYACTEAVAATLEVGVTEKEAAAAMRRWLRQRGVTEWFHLPFAWFGDRTAFRGVRFPHQFFPTNRALTEAMPYILDCAPVVAGCTADVGFTSCLGDNPALDMVLDDLAEFRALIVETVRRRASQCDVYRAVDRLAARLGYEARHHAYPFRVIAHQVWRRPDRTDGSDPGRTAFGFGVATTRTLLRTAAAGARSGRSPLWNVGHLSHRPPEPGLWAVEPHLGWRGVGAKFEELLVVTADDAYWLDDDLPHVRRWQQRGTP